MISSPKCEAVQPQTPIFAEAFFFLLKPPSSEKSLCTGRSLTEQVLIRIRSALVTSSVSV